MGNSGGLGLLGNLFSLSRAFNTGGGPTLKDINRDLRNANRGLNTARRIDRQLERGHEGRALGTLGREVTRQGRAIDQQNRRNYNEAKRGLTREFRASARDIRADINKEYGHRRNLLQKNHTDQRDELKSRFNNGEMTRSEYRLARADLRLDQKAEMRGLRQQKQNMIQGRVGRDAMENYIESRIGPKPGKSEFTETGETMRGIGQIMTTLERMNQ